VKSLFVYNPCDLDSQVPGGVQICSREFLEIVQAASSATKVVAVAVTRNPTWRIRRRLALGSYLLYHPQECKATLTQAVEEFQPTYIFLNKAELIGLAPMVKRLLPHAVVVVMSHGNQSGDDLYEISGPKGRKRNGFRHAQAVWQLGLDLAAEAYYRHRWVDAVCVMSSEEQVLERWLGARKVVVLSRVIRAAPLKWVPVPGRIGYVGTLDHTPNRVALEQICEEMKRQGAQGLEFRLVGRPVAQGEALAAQYPFVKYLGPLDDETLEKEASAWSLFLNPIFWLSRGASMKLGQALAWGLPVLSTRSGTRGYQLNGGKLPTTRDDPVEFVKAVVLILQTTGEVERIQTQVVRMVASLPTVQSLGQHLSAQLKSTCE
jgi:glycosyltransferase involved in cell wall biosynthesis